MKIKKLLNDHSPYLLFLTVIEIILSITCTLAFVYSDSLNYADSKIFEALSIEKLLESLYSSTWWALILLLLAFIAIFSITTVVFKKMDYLFISILLWFVMFILAINIGNPIKDIIITSLLFVPIIIINIIAYKTEKAKINKVSKK